jgi:hypothetical protein
MVCQTARGCSSWFQWPVCTESGLTNYKSHTNYVTNFHLKVEIEESWQALLNGNISFRTVVLVTLFRQLVQCSKWPWKLHSKILSFHRNLDCEDRCVLKLSTLMTEAAGSSDMSLYFYQTTRRQMPKEYSFQVCVSWSYVLQRVEPIT